MHYRRCSGRPVREDREVPVETGAPEGGAGEAVERGNNGQNYYELQPTVGGYQRQWSTARRHVASGGSACFWRTVLEIVVGHPLSSSLW